MLWATARRSWARERRMMTVSSLRYSIVAISLCVVCYAEIFLVSCYREWCCRWQGRGFDRESSKILISSSVIPLRHRLESLAVCYQFMTRHSILIHDTAVKVRLFCLGRLFCYLAFHFPRETRQSNKSDWLYWTWLISNASFPLVKSTDYFRKIIDRSLSSALPLPWKEPWIRSPASSIYPK